MTQFDKILLLIGKLQIYFINIFRIQTKLINLPNLKFQIDQNEIEKIVFIYEKKNSIKSIKKSERIRSNKCEA